MTVSERLVTCTNNLGLAACARWLSKLGAPVIKQRSGCGVTAVVKLLGDPDFDE